MAVLRAWVVEIPTPAGGNPFQLGYLQLISSQPVRTGARVASGVSTGITAGQNWVEVKNTSPVNPVPLRFSKAVSTLSASQ